MALLSVISSSRRPGGADDVRQGGCQILVAELDGREVDSHPRRASSAALPFLDLGAGGPEDPFPQLADHAVLLGQGDEAVGHDQVAVRLDAPDKGFEARQSPVSHTHQGLVDKDELALA
jgi:hypothetical protein